MLNHQRKSAFKRWFNKICIPYKTKRMKRNKLIVRAKLVEGKYTQLFWHRKVSGINIVRFRAPYNMMKYKTIRYNLIWGTVPGSRLFFNSHIFKNNHLRRSEYSECLKYWFYPTLKLKMTLVSVRVSKRQNLTLKMSESIFLQFNHNWGWKQLS